MAVATILRRMSDSLVVACVMCRRKVRDKDVDRLVCRAGSMFGRTSIVSYVRGRGRVKSWMVGIVSMRQIRDT